MLIPNNKYFDIFGGTPTEDYCPADSSTFDGVFAVGYTAVVQETFKSLGLDDILSCCFGSMAYKILTVAGYAVREGATMYNIDDYIAYDVTSISTYSNGIVEAEYGYNRDHEDLKQINIGMFTATKSRLPVYYENYNGSLTDKSELCCILENAKEVGIDSVNMKIK